jgi:hypothetical protein
MVTVSSAARTSTNCRGRTRRAGTEYNEASNATRQSLADVPQMPVGHQIRLGGQRPQRGVVAFGAHCDDLAVGAVPDRAAKRYPGGEGGVQFQDRAERSARQDVIADDGDLPLHPSLPGGPVGGQLQPGHDRTRTSPSG